MEELSWGAAVIGTICLIMSFVMAWWTSDSNGFAEVALGLLLWLLMAIFSLPFLIVVSPSNRVVAGLVVFVSAVGFLMPTAKRLFFRIVPRAPVK